MLLRNINVVKRGKNNRNFDVGVKTILNNFSLDKYWPFITIYTSKTYISTKIFLSFIPYSRT